MIVELNPALKVAIADADPQGSASIWLKDGKQAGVKVVRVAGDKEGRTLKKELSDLSADVVILDLPPQVEALSLRAALYSVLILIPVGPSLLDIKASKLPLEVAREAIDTRPEIQVMLVPTRVRDNTAAGREIRDVLATMGRVSTATIRLRQPYADSAMSGLGINRYAPGTPAYLETRQLAQEVMEILGLEVSQ